MKKLLRISAGALAVLLMLGGCSSGAADPDQPPLASNSVIVADDSIPEGVSPNITGVITSVTDVREGIIMLVEIPDANKNRNTANIFYVTVTGNAVVESNDRTRYESCRDLAPGDTVSVWFRGVSTGTTPEYAVAQGVRVTSKVEDLLMTVRQGDNVIMASPTEGEVTSSDLKPLLYGSYLITDGNGSLYLSFARQPSGVTASAVSAQSGETTYLTNDVSVNELELPGTLNSGEYLVTVKAEYEEGADYYVFTLKVL